MPGKWMLAAIPLTDRFGSTVLIQLRRAPRADALGSQLPGTTEVR